MQIRMVESFATSSEIETLVCGIKSGNANNEQWTDIGKLAEVIKADHGYNNNSKAFKMFLQYVTELDSKDRPVFIQFLTGCPRLPTGGFGGLEPHLTVV